MLHPSTAVIYAYGENGPDHGGRPQQIQRCQAYAVRHQLQVLEVVSEQKWTGPTLNRPAFGAVFTTCTTQPSPPSILLLTDTTRLGRSMDLHEISYIEYRLQRAGITIIEVDGAACQGQETARRLPIPHCAIGEWLHELLARCPELK